MDRIKLQTCDHSMDMRHTTTLHFDSPVACAIGWEPTLGHIHTEISQRTVTHAVGTEHSLQQQDRTNLEDLCPHVHRQPAYPFQPPSAHQQSRTCLALAPSHRGWRFGRPCRLRRPDVPDFVEHADGRHFALRRAASALRRAANAALRAGSAMACWCC